MKRVRGSTYIGHEGGYLGNTTQTLIQPDDKVGVIVLTNTIDSYPADIANKLMATVGAAIAKVTAARPQGAAWDPAWERFAGLYRSRWDDVQVVLLNQQLILIEPNGRSLDPMATLEPIGDGRFRFMSPTGVWEVGEVVRFVEEPGQPMRMFVGDLWRDRIPAR